MIKKIIFILVLIPNMLVTNLWGSDIENIKEYELVSFERTWTGKSKNIPSHVKIYYVGKMVLDNDNKKIDFVIAQNIPEDISKQVSLVVANWQSGASSIYHDEDDAYYKIGSEKFPVALDSFLYRSSIRAIDPKVGQKYFKEGKSLSEGDELRQAIIGMDERK